MGYSLTKKFSTLLFIIFLLFIASQFPVHAALNNPIFHQDQLQYTSFKKLGLKIHQSKGFIISNINGSQALINILPKPESSLYDLRLSFDHEDFINNYNIIRSCFETNTTQKYQGTASAKFVSGNDSIILFPNKNSILYNTQGSSLQSFTIEFALYSYYIGEGTQTIASYVGTDIDNPDNTNSYGFTITIEGGVIYYNFINLFRDAHDLHYSFTLKEQKPLTAQKWETHTVSIDTANKVIKIYRNGHENEVLLITQDQTSTGSELYLVNTLKKHHTFPLTIGQNALFSLDDFVIYRNIYSDYNHYPSNYKSYFETEVFQISTNYSWLDRISLKSPNTQAHYKLAYRFSPKYFIPNTSSTKLPWIYIDLTKNKFPPSQSMGKYIQWRLEYFTLSDQIDDAFRVQDISLAFRENPSPSGVEIHSILADDGGINITWNSLPDDTIACYEIYYGDKPSNYFGKASISPASPINIPHPPSLRSQTIKYHIQGLENERPYYISIRVKDIYGVYSKFSPEKIAIPSSVKNNTGYSIGR